MRFLSFALPAAFGGLAALGHAPFGLWWLAVAGFAGLIWAVGRSARPALAAWLAGAGHFAVTLHWIVEPFFVDVARHGWMAPFALVFMAGGLALFWAAAGWLAGRAQARRALVFATALALAEIVRGHVLTGFPWALPAYVWVDTPLIAGAARVGPYGLSFATLLFAGTLAGWAASRTRRGLAPVAGAGLLLATLSLPLGDPGGASPGGVRVVQPNAPQDEKWDPERAHIFVDRLIEMTAAPKDGVDLVVWPETALPYFLENAGPVFPEIADAAGGVPVVFGINRTERPRIFNALAVLGGDGGIAQVYDKVRLVPFGEFIPAGGLTRRIGLRSFAARDGFGFSAGGAVVPVATPLGPALPMICYEAIFPAHGRGLDERPAFLLQITNDAWFGTFSGPYQHLDQARFRAVEHGLPLVRAANTGVSAVIDARGRVTGALALGETGFLDLPLPPPAAPTLYSRTGDVPAIVAVLSMLAALMIFGRRNGVAKAPPTS